MPELFCSACLQPNHGSLVCPHCGWSKATEINPSYLSPGTIVYPPYQLARVLGHGGFGITYLGWDANLQIKVAIKEYLPTDLAYRDSVSRQVLAYADDSRQYFAKGLNSFLEEARVLARFQQHPGIVSVLSFFRAFGTGYMVMEYVEGETLKSYLQRFGRLSWTQTLDIFMQIMDALRVVHQSGLLHRDIAPDNIYLCGDGRIKLLDFGAAQADLAKSSKDAESAAIMVKQGFAPPEQYRGPREQGPWSDVYSLAASMYYCLTGLSPPDALERQTNDTLMPPSAYGVVMPVEAEHALMSALAVSSLQRPQSIETLQKQIFISQPQLAPPALKREVGIGQSTQTTASSWPLMPSNNSSPVRRVHWLIWLLVGMVCVFLLMFVFRQAPNQADNGPSKLEQIERTETQIHSEDQDSKLARQIEQERQIAAEEFKRQQAAALKRIEESMRQSPSQPINPNQPDARQTEHLRSLCSEWGATMDCKDIQ